MTALKPAVHDPELLAEVLERGADLAQAGVIATETPAVRRGSRQTLLNPVVRRARKASE